MAAVTICSDFGAQELVCLSLLPFFPLLFAMKWWDWIPWSWFFECWVKPGFSLSAFNLIRRLFSSSSLSAIRVVSSAYIKLLRFLLAILIPAYDSSSPAFCMMCSAEKLNKQGDNIQPCHTPFPILNQSVFPCLVLTLLLDPYTNFSGDR